VAGLASAALPEGALFAPVLVLTYIFRSNSRTLARRTYEGVGLVVVALLGLGAFLLFLYAHFGTSGALLEPLQIWTTGLDWASLSFALSPINALTQAFYYGFAPAPLDLPRLLAAWSVLVPPVLLMLLGARFLSFEQELLGWLLWVVPLISGVGPGYAGSAHWLSMGRVMAVALPLELIIGAVIVRFRWLGPCLLTASAGFFALFCYLAGAGVALG